MSSGLEDVKDESEVGIGAWDPAHEESELESALYIFSKQYPEVNNRDPENVENMLLNTRNRLRKLRFNVNNESPYSTQRKRFLERMENLFARLHPWDTTLLNTFLLELGTGILYLRTSIMNSCKAGLRDPLTFSTDYRRIVDECEKSPRKLVDYSKAGHISRANLAFAYVHTAQDQDIFSELLDTGDYEVLYGTTGHLDTVMERYFPNIRRGRVVHKRDLKNVILRDVYNWGNICNGYGNWVRSQLEDLLPESSLTGVV